MDNQIISLIVGGAIAIVSGIAVQIVQSIISHRSKKKNFTFLKLEDIINSIGNIEQGLQTDIALIYRLRNPETEPQINFSFEEKKLECLIKIYHSELSKDFDILQSKINEYHNTKRELINNQRGGIEDQAKIDTFASNFEDCIAQIKLFVGALTIYGANKIS